MVSSLCQNNAVKNGLKGEAHFVKITAGRRGDGNLIEQKQSFVQLRGRVSWGGAGYFDKMTSAFFSSRFTRQTVSVCTSKTLTSTKRT